MAYISPETRLAMLGIIREARNDLRKWSEEYEAKVRSIKDLKSVSMISCAQEELNLKKKAENLLTLDGDKSVLLKQNPNVCKVVEGQDHQMLARNASGGREMSRNFGNPLGNFVEHMVSQKQQEVSMVENPKMEWYRDGTSPLPKKPPDLHHSGMISATKASPRINEAPLSSVNSKTSIHKLQRKYSCEEVYERMELGLCMFCDEHDSPDHHLKYKRSKIFMTECLGDRVCNDKVDNEVVVKETASEDKMTLEQADFVSEQQVVLPTTSLQRVHATQSQGIKSNDEQQLDTTGQPNFSGEMTTLRLVDSDVMIVNVAGGVMYDKISFTGHKKSELIDMQFSGQRSCQVTELLSLKSPRVWEPGGLPTKADQWYWPDKCKSLWSSAATSDMRLLRQLNIKAKELLSEFQDVPRLLVCASEIGAKIYKPPDANESLLDDETLGKFKRVKELMSEVRFNLVPSNEHYIMLYSEVKWKLRDTFEAEVNYGFHSCWDFTADVTAEWKRPNFSDGGFSKYIILHQLRAYFHVCSEKMVGSVREKSRDARFLVEGLRNCIESFEELSEQIMQEYLLSASVWNLLIKQSRNCCFFEFLLQWKWYPPEQSCQACSGWFLRFWIWPKRVSFFSSRWLIFGEMVALPSYITGQHCVKVSQPQMDVVVWVSKEMTVVTSMWSLHERILVTVEKNYNGNGDAHKLLFPKNHKPMHSRGGFWTLYNTLEQMIIGLQNCSEYKRLEDAAVIRFSALRHGHVENSFAEFHAYDVFHLQRPPEMLTEIISWAKQKKWSRLLNGVQKNGIKVIAAGVYYGLILSCVSPLEEQSWRCSFWSYNVSFGGVHRISKQLHRLKHCHSDPLHLLKDQTFIQGYNVPAIFSFLHD